MIASLPPPECSDSPAGRPGSPVNLPPQARRSGTRRREREAGQSLTWFLHAVAKKGKERVNAYLNLKTLLAGAEATATEAFQAALAAMPPGIVAITLDLGASKDLFAEEEVEALVHAIRDRWPRPACCLARCDNPQAWSRAAAHLSQPLLSWRALVRQDGYRVLGRVPTGTYAVLLRALCYRHERATAEQLAHDPAIVSPHKMNHDAHSLMEYARTGRPSLGPTLADIDSISNDLRNMALQRYIQQIAPGVYRAVAPVSPNAAAFARLSK